MWGVRHESGDVGLLSEDGGASWKALEKGFKNFGVFDFDTLVTFRGQGIERSTDGGATWSKVSDLVPTGRIMTAYKGVGYWLTATDMISSKEKGATWAPHGGPVNAWFGPYFGKEDFLETTDGGANWKVAAPPPPEKKLSDKWFTNAAWDPKNNIFYIPRMGYRHLNSNAESSGRVQGGVRLLLLFCGALSMTVVGWICWRATAETREWRELLELQRLSKRTPAVREKFRTLARRRIPDEVAPYEPWDMKVLEGDAGRLRILVAFRSPGPGSDVHLHVFDEGFRRLSVTTLTPPRHPCGMDLADGDRSDPLSFALEGLTPGSPIRALYTLRDDRPVPVK